MKKQLVYLAILISCFLTPLSAQDSFSNSSTPSKSIFKVLQHSDVTNIIIETNLDSLINVRRRENYQPATFSYENKEGEQTICKIKIKPRGKFRRKICDFPTVKLNFSKKALKAEGMAKFDDYKLVTHCLKDKKESEENILREYLIYKMYNVLSENSFRVQYLNITYIDSQNKYPKIKRTGFLIEDTGELAKRIDAKIYGEIRLPIDSFNLEQYNFVALFQYMVGNVDWNVTPFAKNTKIMKSTTQDKYEVIPYDFDFSGLVETSYTRLAEHIGQKNARQRIFLGHLNPPNSLKSNITLFQSKKEELLECIDNFDLLAKPSRKNIKKYIESFYKDIADGEVDVVPSKR